MIALTKCANEIFCLTIQDEELDKPEINKIKVAAFLSPYSVRRDPESIKNFALLIDSRPSCHKAFGPVVMPPSHWATPGYVFVNVDYNQLEVAGNKIGLQDKPVTIYNCSNRYIYWQSLSGNFHEIKNEDGSSEPLVGSEIRTNHCGSFLLRQNDILVDRFGNEMLTISNQREMLHKELLLTCKI